MADLVINGTTFGPFTGGFSGITPANGTYYSEGGLYGPPPWLGAPVKELEDLTFDGVNGTAVRDRGWRFTPLSCNLIFCGTVSSVNTAVKTFLESLRPKTSLCARFTVSMPDGATLQGCHLRSHSSERWENLSGKCLFLLSCVFHQMSEEN